MDFFKRGLGATMTETQVILLGRNRLFLQGLANLLPINRFVVLGEAADSDALAARGDLGALSRGEVVLMDPPQDAEQLADELRHVRALLPTAVIVVLSDTLCPRMLSAALSAGAKGFLLKSISVDALLYSVELARLGETVLPTKLAGMLVNNGLADMASTGTPALGGAGLSDRETQILSCLVAGNSNKMIANRLTITEATVKVHMKSLLRKIKVNNRTQAAIWAVNHGLSPMTSLAAE